MKTNRIGRGTSRVVTLIFGCSLALSGWVGLVSAADSNAITGAANVSVAPMSEKVTINVDDGLLTQVLNAFSRQTGRSIVVGPEVTGKVTARLSDVPWRDALDSILKPYGYGYYLVGDTIIVSSLEKIEKIAKATAMPTNVTMAAGSVSATPPPEPLVVKVFTLKYLDFADVEALIKDQLSPQGKLSRSLIRSQSWTDSTRNDAVSMSTGSESLGRLLRLQETLEQVKGKTLVIVDTKAVIERVEKIIAQIDKMAIQVQIEAKFVEVRSGLLRDIGVEWGSGANGAVPGAAKNIGFTQKSKLYAAGGQQVSGTVDPLSFAPASGVSLASTTPFNGGLSMAFQKLTDYQFEVLLHLLQEDTSFKLLSSPQIMTMNNQDAVIMVGTKYPIISTEYTPAAGDTPARNTTTLTRYEDVGIKLKVLPQVCDDGYINLIVHPSVKELAGFQSGGDTVGGAFSSVKYPVVNAREAETQIMIKNGQTIVIGGMMRDANSTTQIKVPFLGSIPILGILFRRDTVHLDKNELIIFLTARIRDTTEDLSVKMPETNPLVKVEKVRAPDSVDDGKMMMNDTATKNNGKPVK